MRFGSLYGFLFTWKGINIKRTHTHTVLYSAHNFSNHHRSIFIPPTLGDFSIWRINHQTVYCKWRLFLKTSLKAVRQRKCDRNVRFYHMFRRKTCNLTNPSRMSLDFLFFLLQLLFWFYLAFFLRPSWWHTTVSYGGKQDNLCLHSSLLVKDTKIQT